MNENYKPEDIVGVDSVSRKTWMTQYAANTSISDPEYENHKARISEELPVSINDKNLTLDFTSHSFQCNQCKYMGISP